MGQDYTKFVTLIIKLTISTHDKENLVPNRVPFLNLSCSNFFHQWCQNQDFQNLARVKMSFFRGHKMRLADGAHTRGRRWVFPDIEINVLKQFWIFAEENLQWWRLPLCHSELKKVYYKELLDNCGGGWGNQIAPIFGTSAN